MSRRLVPAPKPPVEPGSRCLLVVEGNDECILVTQLGLLAGTCVFDLHGLDTGTKLTHAAALVGLDPSFPALTSVGLLVDGEDDPAGAFVRAQGFLAAIGYPAPAHSHEVATAGGRTGGICILPDGTSAGALETLQRQAVEPARAACVDALFACTGATPGATRAQRDKAWVHAFAATVDSRARGDRLYGPSPKIDPTHPAFAPLRASLARL